MGIDTKYGKVTMEYGEIGEDEPVIVFRAQDGTVPDLLKVYKKLCRAAGSPEHHLDLIEKTRSTFLNWQAHHSNQVRAPNSNAYMERS